MWADIVNHQSIVERFRESVARNRLASTYLFVGPPGIGKRLFALHLAEVLLCEDPPPTFESCGQCPACQQVRALTHPDLIVISKPADKAFIPIDVFIGDKDRRHQSGLCHDIGLKPFRGGRKIAIVDDADFLNQEGANSLLKTLEEPPPNSLLILIGSSEQQQLPTIVSRSQVIRFNPLSAEQVLSIVERIPNFESDISMQELAAASAGSVGLAMQLSDQETFEFRDSLFIQLASCDPGREEFAKTVMAFVDSAGKDAAKKRARLSLVADFAIQFFRSCYLQKSEINSPKSSGVMLGKSFQQMNQNLPENDDNQVLEILATAIERCDDLQRQVAANVNQANAVEAWLIDLGKICRGTQLAGA